MTGRNNIVLKQNNLEYEYQISSRANKLSISIRRGGRIKVIMPKNAKISQVEAFLKQKTDWILRAVEKMADKKPGLLEIKNLSEYRKLRPAATLAIRKRVREINELYEFKYTKITIRNQTSRWGSCSRNGNLSFSYKLILLPETLRDYVIVHELCHLKEFNHSRNFWKLVENILPDYRDRVLALKKI